MVLRGHIQGETVVLEEPPGLPDGTRVRVEVLESGEQGPVTDASQTLYEQLKDVIGIAKGLPSDMAENHDYYLHGTPKVEADREKKPNEPGGEATASRPTLLERLRPFVGAVQGLPKGMAENHDHYLHGDRSRVAEAE